MEALEGRIAIITGAGRGIGREHALLFAAEGAKVVVNDLGGSADGTGEDKSAAQSVVDEIMALGGEAVPNTDSVTDWEGGQRMIQTAIEHFGGLHILVNNAGILRDRMLVNMSEAEWDAVIHVHLKGHFVPLRWAADYWRRKSKETGPVKASVINTASTSGLLGNVGQCNYGAAKAGIGVLTVIAAQELSRYGVRVNGLCPNARTRLTMATPGLGKLVAEPENEGEFDKWAPANASPIVAALCVEDCTITGENFLQLGNRIARMQPWRPREAVDKTDGRWDVRELAAAIERLPRTAPASLGLG